jgi:hypothetical protein
MKGDPATPSGCQPSASNLRFSRSGIPIAKVPEIEFMWPQEWKGA